MPTECDFLPYMLYVTFTNEVLLIINAAALDNRRQSDACSAAIYHTFICMCIPLCHIVYVVHARYFYLSFNY